MKAGRELDALIAEQVMGWKYFQEAGTGHIELVPPNGEVHHISKLPPFYSTDIAAAWEVVETFATFSLQKNADRTYSAYIQNMNPDEPGKYIASTQTTLPHAICLAALKAVGAK